MGTDRGRRRFYAAGWVISAGVMVVTCMWQLHVREVVTVTALGGRLWAGPQDGGGFQVRAELPARASS